MSVAASLPPHRGDWTVDDLGGLPADLNYELINGRLIVPSPTPAHQDLQGEIWLCLRAACPPEFFASTDQSLKVNRKNEPRPDVVGIRIEHYGRTPVPVEDAAIAVEIVSAHSEWRDMMSKAKIYADSGILTYWVIDQLTDPITLTEFVLDPGAKGYRISAVTTDLFSVTEPWPITVDLPALTKRRAGLLERSGGEEK